MTRCKHDSAGSPLPFLQGFKVALTVPLLVWLVGCSGEESERQADISSPQEAFFDALSSHCGKAYAGELVSDDAADVDFVGAPMVMHVAYCSPDTVQIPFHIGQKGESETQWDRSRTWVITRRADGLRLKHDHRHEDGVSDTVTMYGGDTASNGIARAQDFPVDQESIAMFEREGLSASFTNVWRVEVDPVGQSNAQFAYQLRRTKQGGAPEDRLFRVEFDLTREVETPPPAWGHE